MAKPIIVLKIGGSTASNAQALANIAQDIRSLSSQYSFVLAHGGSAQTNELCKRLGIAPKFYTSPTGVKSRATPLEVARLYVMACGGEANAQVVAALQSAGVNAIGLTGLDGQVVRAKQKIFTAVEDGKQKMVRDDYTGKIEGVNAGLLRMLLDGGYTPVVAALAIGESEPAAEPGPASRTCIPLNIDGDRLMAALAGALGADKALSLTDVDGYYRNFPNDLVPKLTASELEVAMQNAGAGAASGGMKKKLMGCIEAIRGGVNEVIICNGRKEKPISAAISGAGTHITKD